MIKSSDQKHEKSDRHSNSVRRAVMPDSGEVTSHEYTPADKREGQEGVDRCEQACIQQEMQQETVRAYLCAIGTCWMKCVIILAVMYCTWQPGWLGNLHVKSNIANGIAISWIMTCCVLLVMSPASNQIATVGQNTPAPTNNLICNWEREQRIG